MESEKNIKKGKTNILAEDDRFIARAYNDGFMRAGYDVIYAEDGAKALEKLKGAKPDIILLDVIMPEKNGFEVLTEIKKDENLKSIPVIILSNLGQDSDIKKGKDLGADDYFIKSNLSISEVLEKIEMHIKK
jgi:DNA-binding response OmpR family regulator